MKPKKRTSPTKKPSKRHESDSFSQSSDSDSLDLAGDAPQSEVFSFTFLEPHLNFSEPMAQILKRSFNFSVDVFQLIEAIASQPEMGVLVSSDDEENKNIFGICTLLSTVSMKKNKFLDDFLKILEKKVGQSAVEKIKKAGPRVGMFVNERFVNLPFELVPGIYSEIVKDLEFIKSDPDYTPEERAEYDFSHLIYVVVMEERVDKDGKNERIFFKPEDSKFAGIGDKLGEVKLTDDAEKSADVYLIEFKAFWKLFKSKQLFS